MSVTWATKIHLSSQTSSSLWWKIHFGAYDQELHMTHCLVSCSQELQHPWRRGKPWAFLICPSAMLQKLNPGQVHGVPSPFTPLSPGPNAWMIDWEKWGSHFCPSLHLEFRSYFRNCKLRISETLSQPRVLLLKLRCRPTEMRHSPHSQFWSNNSEMLLRERSRLYRQRSKKLSPQNWLYWA